MDQTEDRDRMLGRTLGHYRIVEKIGAGGMGEVYRARDERLERDVALKVLRSGTLFDEAARRRFRKEALALSRLNHPNIATVHDFDTQDGMDFLVMECVAGQTLSAMLQAGPLPEKEITRLGVQLAEGLEAAHDRGIVHRDLKPGNLRLTPDGRLKILDFGLAKLVRPSSETAATETMTEAHGLEGTLPYMAPEQLRGEAIDARTDIWAAGVVLYEMATGRRAFPEAENARVITAILTKPPSMPSAVHWQASAGLDSIIVKCMEKDPERRYQSAKELAVDLRRLETPSAVGAARPVLPRKRPRRIVVGLVSLAAAVLVLGLALNVGGLRERLFSGVPQIQALAVLPLKNLSGDSAQEYFSDGMTDAVINNLCKVAALRVISTTSVMQYKGTRKSLTKIARELGVDAVVEGSVLRSGGRVRINAQLIRPGKERQLWAASYEREMKDVLALQSEVASTIADAVRTRLTPEDRTRLASTRTVNPEAYEEYLLGQRYREWTGEMDLEKSRDQFLRAIQIDPEFAPAYAGLASCYTELALWSKLSPKEAAPLGLEAATKAIQLDGELAEAQVALGIVKLQLLWDWAGAESAFKRALELNPNSHEANYYYRFLLACAGRNDVAIPMAVALLRNNPNSPTEMMSLAWTYFYARHYDDTIVQTKRILELKPEWGDARVYLAASYAFKGMHVQALAECDTLEQHLERMEEFWDVLLGEVYGVSGRRDKALQVLGRLRERERHDYVDPVSYALVYAGMGDKEQAFAWLEKAVAVRSTNVLQMSVEPVLEGLHSDPRFGELLRIVGPPSATP
jgi:eukaryotic-like serine/threonine-protein kinase